MGDGEGGVSDIGQGVRKGRGEGGREGGRERRKGCIYWVGRKSVV